MGRRLVTGFKYNAICIKECPAEIDSTFDCMGTSKISEELCKMPIDKQTGVGYIGYGTDSIFGKFCLPNINKLPPEIDLDQYNNLIGSFGLDDI